jgi:hypothetical protein
LQYSIVGIRLFVVLFEMAPISLSLPSVTEF